MEQRNYWSEERITDRTLRFSLRDGNGNTLVSMLASKLENFEKSDEVFYDFRVNDPLLAQSIGLAPGDYTIKSQGYMDKKEAKAFLDSLRISEKPNLWGVEARLMDPELERIFNLCDFARQISGIECPSDAPNYWTMLEIVLDRPIYNYEFAVDRESLEAELNEAIQRHNMTGDFALSEEESEKREGRALGTIVRDAKSRGMKVLYSITEEDN